MEYPVGISYWAYGTAVIAQAIGGEYDAAARAQIPSDQLFGDHAVERESTLFIVVNAVGFALLVLLTTWLLAGVDRRRPWDATWFAVSPVLALTALINWDLLAVALVAAALWTWARDRPLATGLLIGLGTATKLYPLFLLGGILVICVRQRRWGDLGAASAATAAGWVALNLPALLTGPTEWKVFWTFNQERGPDLGSIWLVMQQVAGRGISADAVNLGSELFFAVWCLLVAFVGWRARRTPSLAQLGFLIVAGFLLVNKVYSPQYVLWLLPLAVLARPRWRDQLIWQATEIVYFCSVWWFLDGDLAPAAGGDPGFYWLAIWVRMAGELYLIAMVVRDIRRGTPDVVTPPPRLRRPAPVAASG
ncbi:glycosyltransferase 87 family protein [Nocardioides sp. TRM66260-LWL]|nr:glycosyltransferase 87 family protein [Nocardioides sp. TRM66260-LWL]